MARGRFITFEGIDGAGKSTHIGRLAEALRSRNIDVHVTREPGGTPLGERIRELLLHEAMDAVTETLLVFAARRDHVETVIRPALNGGRWVLCDRFTDATIAYQGGGRGVSRAWIAQLAETVHAGIQPDQTFWFDTPPDIAAARLAKGREQADRFEREQTAFFARVRDEYARLHESEPKRIVRLDGTLPPDDIYKLLEKAVLTI